MLDCVPELAVAQPLTPIVAERMIEMALPCLVHDRGGVNAVRHETDWIVLWTNLRPMIRAQTRRHDTMNAAHAVHAARAVEREARHVEEARHSGSTAEVQEPV